MEVTLQKKEYYKVGNHLGSYLQNFGRTVDIPMVYEDMLGFSSAFPLMDAEGNDTLWLTVQYPRDVLDKLYRQLSAIYSLLKTGDTEVMAHLYIERVDFCEFGNSRPFRVRVVNQFNDNYDHFYVKIADASRVYGLELEHILSPNRISYLVNGETLVEEHIPGLPGDVFLNRYMGRNDVNRVRLAKEFVKFNERSFVRLLGDMRSYNYVVDITPDFEEVHYRVRAIDFDQQSYEGAVNHYLPHFFKENAGVVKLCTELLNYPTMKQYQHEERTLIDRRAKAEPDKLAALFAAMRAEPCSPEEKVAQLREELGKHHKTTEFAVCRCMADLVQTNLRVMLDRVKR